jgi:hypothetical protein
VAPADPDSIHHIFLTYLDRSNYSIGAVGGLTERLHISSAQVGLLGGLFFLGYFLFQVPAGGVCSPSQSGCS